MKKTEKKEMVIKWRRIRKTFFGNVQQELFVIWNIFPWRLYIYQIRCISSDKFLEIFQEIFYASSHVMCVGRLLMSCSGIGENCVTVQCALCSLARMLIMPWMCRCFYWCHCVCAHTPHDPSFFSWCQPYDVVTDLADWHRWWWWCLAFVECPFPINLLLVSAFPVAGVTSTSCAVSFARHNGGGTLPAFLPVYFGAVISTSCIVPWPVRGVRLK